MEDVDVYVVMNTLHICLTILLLKGNIMWLACNTCIITDKQISVTW